MQAAKLKKKKGTINKGQMKKTIKNVICRPDPVFWPVVTEAEGNLLGSVITKHRVYITDFKKPHWDKLKLIPKDERPKPPPFKKVNGLLFGLSVCQSAIHNEKCSALLIEALVEPQMIFQPIIEACISSDIPVVCLKNLKMLTLTNFGIQTSCLGIIKDSLEEFSDIIKNIYRNYKHQFKMMPKNDPKSVNVEILNVFEKLDSNIEISNPPYNPYLLRKDKKTRVYVPSYINSKIEIDNFNGQNLIKILKQKIDYKVDDKSFLKMMLKKTSNNPKRVKQK